MQLPGIQFSLALVTFENLRMKQGSSSWHFYIDFVCVIFPVSLAPAAALPFHLHVQRERRPIG